MKFIKSIVTVKDTAGAVFNLPVPNSDVAVTIDELLLAFDVPMPDDEKSKEYAKAKAEFITTMKAAKTAYAHIIETGQLPEKEEEQAAAFDYAAALLSVGELKGQYKLNPEDEWADMLITVQKSLDAVEEPAAPATEPDVAATVETPAAEAPTAETTVVAETPAAEQVVTAAEEPATPVAETPAAEPVITTNDIAVAPVGANPAADLELVSAMITTNDYITKGALQTMDALKNMGVNFNDALNGALDVFKGATAQGAVLNAKLDEIKSLQLAIQGQLAETAAQ